MKSFTGFGIIDTYLRTQYLEKHHEKVGFNWY